jgi:HD-GYP domain-containing protein (c-di-GMP phosphodiesterase class II)
VQPAGRTVIRETPLEAIAAALGDKRSVRSTRRLSAAIDGHARRVARWAQRTAIALDLSAEAVERVGIAGVLHDIGKVDVSPAVLEKPGPLDETEREHVRRHPLIGARLLAGTPFAEAAPIVIAHHEQPDGRGYPLGLCGNEIPFEACIVSVADAYDAMRSDRCYRRALPLAEARAELVRGSGTQFHPGVVDAFLAVRAERAARS